MTRKIRIDKTELSDMMLSVRSPYDPIMMYIQSVARDAGMNGYIAYVYDEIRVRMIELEKSNDAHVINFIKKYVPDKRERKGYISEYIKLKKLVFTQQKMKEGRK